MSAVPEELHETVLTILDLFVRKDYRELERLTNGERLTAQMMEKVISDYGRTLSMPKTLPLMDVLPIHSSLGESWSIYVPFWTIEEGKSDLTVLLRLDRRSPGALAVTIEDIRVL